MVVPRGTRVRMVLFGVALLVLPLVLVFIRLPQVRTLLPSFSRTTTAESRYSAQSTISGYTVRLTDVVYLDFVTASLNVFLPNAVVSPSFYFDRRYDGKRMSVTHIRFELVESVTRPISTVLGMENTRTVATGDYVIEGDTLVVRNAVRFDALEKAALVKKFAWEDAFLRASVSTLYYALGKTNPQEDVEMLGKLKQDIDENVYTGLFPWPFRITEKLL